MNKGRNTHAPYMTFTALNRWTIFVTRHNTLVSKQLARIMYNSISRQE